MPAPNPLPYRCTSGFLRCSPVAGCPAGTVPSAAVEDLVSAREPAPSNGSRGGSREGKAESVRDHEAPRRLQGQGGQSLEICTACPAGSFCDGKSNRSTRYAQKQKLHLLRVKRKGCSRPHTFLAGGNGPKIKVETRLSTPSAARAFGRLFQFVAFRPAHFDYSSWEQLLARGTDGRM